MISIFDKLNLRPQERRLVMTATVVLFVVINVWLVVPHFGEWKQLLAKIKVAEETATIFETEIAKTGSYKAKLENLQSEAQFVLADERDLALVQTIQTAAASANVFVQRVTPSGGGPIPNNPFFEEQRVTLNAVATDGELVDFLKRLGSGNSLIRVRDLDLKLDSTGQKLLANLTIVGNYQKKPMAKPGTPQKGNPQPAERPASGKKTT